VIKQLLCFPVSRLGASPGCPNRLTAVPIGPRLELETVGSTWKEIGQRSSTRGLLGTAVKRLDQHPVTRHGPLTFHQTKQQIADATRKLFSDALAHPPSHPSSSLHDHPSIERRSHPTYELARRYTYDRCRYGATRSNPPSQ
jgi:hypothetical protein